MSWIAGVDVGGTFTDVVILNMATGEMRVGKVPTTGNQAEGFLAGLKHLGQLAELEAVVHGTTVGTNAMLERTGATVGLITTEGFRDLLEIGRRTRPHPYGLTGNFQPLVPRRLRIEVPERIDAEGKPLKEFDVDAVKRAAETLLEGGAEALVIGFLHSYADPSNELAAAAAVEGLWPNAYVSLSHDVLPEVGEFERFSTTAINAYLQPLIDRYLRRVDAELARAGFDRPFRVMQSNGGALTARNVARHAGRSVLSGPAGGAIAAAWIGSRIGCDAVISADMGGTSFDVAIIVGGEPMLTAEKEFSYSVPSRIPMIDIETIGAGGGSIAAVNEAGLLTVGPRSARSIPGPIVYGRGGTEPTVTDANAVLGRLDSTRIVETDAQLLVTAKAAFAKLGGALQSDAEGAALATLKVVDLNMANAIKRLSLEKGIDPRRFALMPFGGAGPMHACAIAEELEIPRIVVPAYPGVTSAFGCLIADIRHDDTWSFHRIAAGVSTEEVSARYQAMVDRVMAVMVADGVDPAEVAITYEAALQYDGQTHRLMIAVDTPDIDGAALAEIFRRDYRARFTVEVPDAPIRLVNLRVRGSAARKMAGEPVLPIRRGGEAAPIGAARARFEGGWMEMPVYRRWEIPVGAVIAGPARIEQSDSTTLLRPGWTATATEQGILELAFRKAGA